MPLLLLPSFFYYKIAPQKIKVRKGSRSENLLSGAITPAVTMKEDGSAPRIHPWSEKKDPRSPSPVPGSIGGVAFFNSKI
ncbi:hypothetical protein QUB28_24525 [Microcoleus sp. B4-C3]